jgi:hypothetical protein
MSLADKQSDLAQFYGTENYHRGTFFNPRLVLTDGTKFVADNGGGHGAYWLMEAIGSYQHKLLKNEDQRLSNYQFWKLTVKDNKAVLECRADSNEKPVVRQEIEHTDFDLPEIELWVERADENLWVILLPSEH